MSASFSRRVLVAGLSFLFLLFAVFLFSFSLSQAQLVAAYHIRDDATGGDCGLIGSWEPATKSCMLNTDLNVAAGDGLQIESSGITLNGGGHTISGNATGTGVYISGLSGVRISNLTISGFSKGLHLSGSNASVVDGLTITASADTGVLVNQGSSGNTVSGSEIVGSANLGIDLSGLTAQGNNVLTDNRVHDNGLAGIQGLSATDGTVVSGNELYLNPTGIQAGGLGWSIEGNQVHDNSLSGIALVSGAQGIVVRLNQLNHNGYGVYLNAASNNTIYHNNFLGNATQAAVVGGAGNLFSLPARTGGNFWSDWTSPVGDDGFITAPYVFSGGQDSLPWNTQAGWLDTSVPAVTNVQPAGTIYEGSTTVSADYEDTQSGVNTNTVHVTLDGAEITASCVVTEAGVSCPVSGLAYGNHALGGSVRDLSGNESPISGGFSVGDNQAPAVTYTGPSGFIDTASPTVTATFTDAQPSSGITGAELSLNGAPPLSCQAAAGSVSCSVSGLSDGHYEAVILVHDGAGNTGMASGSLDVDTVAPSVSDVWPSGTIPGSPPTLSANYTDPAPASGINTASVSLSLDGQTLNGCSVTESRVSCPAGSVGSGAHTISGSVSDNAGHVSPISGSFTVSNTISQDTTWTEAGSPYVISGSGVTVNAGATLTIEPGVVVKFQSTSSSLTVNGTLNATDAVFTSYKDDAHGGDTNGDGSATSPAPGNWRAIYFSGGAGTLNGCTVLYGGSYYAGQIAITGSSPTITGSTVSSSSSSGIYADSGSPTITNNAITNNQGSFGIYSVAQPALLHDNTISSNGNATAVQIPATLGQGNVYNNSYSGNKYNAMRLYSTGVTATTTWPASNSPYVIAGVSNVNNSSVLTIEAGAVVKFDMGAVSVNAGSTLNASGVV